MTRARAIDAIEGLLQLHMADGEFLSAEEFDALLFAQNSLRVDEALGRIEREGRAPARPPSRVPGRAGARPSRMDETAARPALRTGRTYERRTQ